MKRYWLFAYNNYYPYGGMRDFAGDFDTIEEAVEFENTTIACGALTVKNGYAHIFDTIEHKIVSERGFKGWGMPEGSPIELSEFTEVSK